MKLFDADDISEDRMIALRKRAEVDSKYIIIFVPNDDVELKQSLNRHDIVVIDSDKSFFSDFSCMQSPYVAILMQAGEHICRTC